MTDERAELIAAIERRYANRPETREVAVASAKAYWRLRATASQPGMYEQPKEGEE